MLITPEGNLCSTCRAKLRMITSTLGVCPSCSSGPASPIDYRVTPELRRPRVAERSEESWRREPPTERQLNFLSALVGYEPAGVMKGDAAELIAELA